MRITTRQAQTPRPPGAVMLSCLMGGIIGMAGEIGCGASAFAPLGFVEGLFAGLLLSPALSYALGAGRVRLGIVLVLIPSSVAALLGGVISSRSPLPAMILAVPVYLATCLLFGGWRRTVVRWQATAAPEARCSRCGYVLAGLPSGTCPECGTVHPPREAGGGEAAARR